MSFGSSSSSKKSGRNPAITSGGSSAPYTPQSASSSVLLAGLMGMRPQSNPATATAFAGGGQPGLGRRPALQKRIALGGM